MVIDKADYVGDCQRLIWRQILACGYLTELWQRTCQIAYRNPHPYRSQNIGQFFRCGCDPFGETQGLWYAAQLVKASGAQPLELEREFLMRKSSSVGVQDFQRTFRIFILKRGDRRKSNGFRRHYLFGEEGCARC